MRAEVRDVHPTQSRDQARGSPPGPWQPSSWRGDPRLEDRVADNNHKFDITESESLLIGRDFGVVTDIETGPNGNLFLVSLDQGEVHQISRR